MPLSPEKLHHIPLLRSLSEDHRVALASVFTTLQIDAGTVLFNAGSEALNLYILSSGEVELRDGDEVEFSLHSPTLIGELGGLTGLARNTTAVATKDSEVLRVSRDDLLAFFASNGDIAFSFFQSLTMILAQKVRRDQKRMSDMRTNLIRTQKSMKKLRDFLLESQDTPVSETVHDTLDDLIRTNRRVNYRISPPNTMPANIRLDSGSILSVVEISRTHVSYQTKNGSCPTTDDNVSGVLQLTDGEIPISGQVLRTIGGRVDMQLDLLIDEYSTQLDDYLTNVQLLDFVV